MIKNYFILNRIVKNIDELLSGYTIISVFSQEKEKIILECRRKEDVLFLEISVNPHLPYITIRNKFARAKKNVLTLFKEIFPSPIVNISMAESDRIVKFVLNNAELYFFIRGGRTNLFAVYKKKLLHFKKISEETSSVFLNEINQINFIPGLLQFMPDDKYFGSNKELLSRYPFISKELLAESGLRNSANLKDNLLQVISDIQHKKPAIYTSENDIKLAVAGFKLFESWNIEIFDNITDAVNNFIQKKYSSENFEFKKKSLLSSIEKELERTASKINNLKGRIDAGTKEEEYNKIGNLLLINLDKIEKGTAEITVEDIYNNNNFVKIKIDPSVSPYKNADKYFDKARSERINYNKSLGLYKTSVEKYNKLKEKQKELSQSEKLDDIKKMDTGSQSSRSDKDDLKSKFRQYIIDGKYNLFIGRDSENNDLLTTRFAKQNDYWFHARSVSGSHAVLKVENTKEPVPKPVLKKAASIAAFHSKAKTSSLAPVSYTLKKYVTKKKGMGAGKVSLLKEEVLLVKPEIPAGCEYISRE